MDGGWLLLAAIALRSPGARPFAALLVASWSLTYLAILDPGGRIDGYAVSLVFDVWACACGTAIIVMERHRPVVVRFGGAIIALWLAWLAVQGVYWWNYHRGVDIGLLAFHASRWIFTAQMALAAIPGAHCLWLEARGRHHRLRRMARV